MSDIRPAILIAEDQIFIALEAERIISEVFDFHVEFCRRDRLSEVLSEASFHMVILEYTGNQKEDTHYAFLVRQAGAELVLLSAVNDLADVSLTFPSIPMIKKPFNEAELRNFVSGFLLRREPI